MGIGIDRTKGPKNSIGDQETLRFLDGCESLGQIMLARRTQPCVAHIERYWTIMWWHSSWERRHCNQCLGCPSSRFQEGYISSTLWTSIWSNVVC